MDATGFPTVEKTFTHNPLIPYDPSVLLYIGAGDQLIPFEYSSWMDEVTTWKDGCYISHSLNPMPTWSIKGPEAKEFLSSVLVNNLERFPIGSGKHAILCNETGHNMGDGVLLRTGEEEYIGYELGALYIAYLFEQSDYDAVAEILTGKRFLYQVAGPRSLEILEAATGDDLHDIRFMHHRMSSIDGMPVRILRVGMAGTLAYELHGEACNGRAVYAAVLKAGEAFGIKRIGFRAYLMNHTEDGFPQAFVHFPHPWVEDEAFVSWLQARGELLRHQAICKGSLGTDIRQRYRTPVELGWANRISFNHEFTGKAALQAEVNAPRRKMVTLEWNPEDIVDVYASKFRDEEPYLNMDAPSHNFSNGDALPYHADKVLMGGELVGVSSGRTYSSHYRQMLSLCSIDVAHAEIGTEVVVVWGHEGMRQKHIRATVARFPYLNENRNEDIDVNEIPRRSPLISMPVD